MMFVTCFLQWCPPCMKLLPEWRKAGKKIGGKLAHFGTVDCTVHHQLCVKVNFLKCVLVCLICCWLRISLF